MSSTSNPISLASIEQARREIDPVFLHSPQYDCEPLSAELDTTLVLKVETLNPIRSFKGRGADLLVAQAGSKLPLVCASAGNFGQAMAYACRKRQIPLTVYASIHANPLKIERMRQLGATVILAGNDFDAAKEIARRAALEMNGRFVEDGRDLETAEGAGTIGLELLALPEPLDVMLVPLGNGALFNGIAFVLKQHRPEIQMVAVQAAGAPAMVESWRAKRVIQHSSIATLADGIGVRVPIPSALTCMEPLIDDALLVQESSIVAAMRLIHRHAGVVVEPSGAVGVAAILENRDRFRKLRVGTILCGGNLTAEQMQTWLK